LSTLLHSPQAVLQFKKIQLKRFYILSLFPSMFLENIFIVKRAFLYISFFVSVQQTYDTTDFLHTIHYWRFSFYCFSSWIFLFYITHTRTLTSLKTNICTHLLSLSLFFAFSYVCIQKISGLRFVFSFCIFLILNF